VASTPSIRQPSWLAGAAHLMDNDVDEVLHSFLVLSDEGTTTTQQPRNKQEGAHECV
jgi:hypothetical protein